MFRNKRVGPAFVFWLGTAAATWLACPSYFSKEKKHFVDSTPMSKSCITVEYAMEMKNETEEADVKQLLGSMEGVEEYSVDWQKQLVLVRSSCTSVEIADALESLGKQVRIRGFGNEEQKSLGAGVCIMRTKNIKGVVRFIQLNEEKVLVEGTIHGLPAGHHGIHVYSTGNIIDNGKLLINHYNPQKKLHGSVLSKESHAGDLGNILVGEDGKTNFRIETPHFHVQEIIGRAVGVTEGEDDLGKGENEQSKANGNSGTVLACGVIARSAGLFQNPKKICLCNGATLWEEDRVG